MTLPLGCEVAPSQFGKGQPVVHVNEPTRFLRVLGVVLHDSEYRYNVHVIDKDGFCNIYADYTLMPVQIFDPKIKRQMFNGATSPIMTVESS